MILRTLGLAACLACLALTAPALAADQAKELFERGVDGMAAGRYDEACPLIEQSYRLDPRPMRLFALAECEATRGRIATAVARYDEYLAAYEALSPQLRRQQGNRAKWAKTQQASIVPHVPKLVVVLAPGAPPGTVVTRDGATIAESALGTPLPTDPGEHVIVARAPGGPPTEVRVTVGRDERRRVEIAAQSAPPPPPPPPPQEASQTSGQRKAAYALGGVALASLAAGGVLGGLALAEKGTVDDNCGIGGITGACNPAGKAAADRLQARGTGSTIALAAGGALAVTAIVLFATEPKPGRAVSLRGVRAALLEGGASVGVVGAW